MEWTPPEIGALAPPSNSTTVIYETHEAEFVDACFGAMLGQKGQFRPVLTFLFTLGIVGLAGQLLSGPRFALQAVVATAVFSIGIYCLTGWGLERRFRAMYQRIRLHGPIELVYGEGFLGTRTSNGLAGTKVLFGMKKLSSVRTVYSSPNVFFVVPLRVFSNDADVQEFDRIVAALSARGAV